MITNTHKNTTTGNFQSLIFQELTAEESSNIVGGFTVRNDSGGTRRFYNLGANVAAQLQTLQPNAEGTYDGEYAIYNKSTTGFEPVLVKVDPTKTASFRQEGNGITLATNSPIIFSN